MFETMTFERIMQDMLARVPPNIDKRQGAVIYDALAPACMEFAKAYAQLEYYVNETFADTASRIYLVERAKERGLYPYPATYAILKGEFNISVEIGTRFSLNELNYKVVGKIDELTYRLQCETIGTKGNQYFGALIPIETIQGLKKAELTELLIPAEDEEETEEFRLRYLHSFEPQAYGGNIADYKQKVKKIAGVGAVKVYPVWNGGGTVKLVLLDSNYQKPSSVLIEDVQTIIDPIQNQGKGLGVAPIGHVVTVEAVQEEPIDITFHITYKTGFNWEDIKPYAEKEIDDYFFQLRKQWEDSETTLIKVLLLETRLIQLEGVEDLQDTEINGIAGNYQLLSDKVPIRGNLNG